MRCTSLLFGLLAGVLLLGCGDDSGTSVGGGQMYTTHSSVSDGLAAAGDVIAAAGTGVFGINGGAGISQIRDGWSVEYTKLLVTLGPVTLRDTSDGDIALVATNIVIDLQNLPAGGTVVDRAELREGPTSIEFTLPQAVPGDTVPLSPVTQAQDAEMMATNGWALYIEGTIEKPGGTSCKPDAPADCVPAPMVRFAWGLPHGVAYANCVWNDPAVAPENVTLTFPAVNWLQTSIAAEAPQMRAQWIADADLDRDGQTTVDELKQIKAAALLTPRRGYDLSGASGSVDTVYDFLREQARTLGLRSWGECGSASDL